MLAITYNICFQLHVEYWFQGRRGDPPKLSTLISWKVVVGAQLISNGSKAEVEGKRKEHSQYDGATNAEPKGYLTGKCQACCCCCSCAETLP